MISIIIPTYNEAEQIAKTIQTIKSNANENNFEIIIVDGGSYDDTISIATKFTATTLSSPKKGRAAQMNVGAANAKGDVLYFLHADSIPPKNFLTQITNAIGKDFSCGCFRLQFDYDHWFLKANAWFTRFDVNAVRFGDQSLFVTKNVFEKSGGFREDLSLMEDQDIIHRLKKHGKFIVMNDVVITSARKYECNGIYRTQGIFFRIWSLYYLGYSQEYLLKLHKRLIKHNKF